MSLPTAASSVTPHLLHSPHLRWLAAVVAALLLWLASSAALAGDLATQSVASLALVPAAQVSTERSHELPPAGAWPGAASLDAYGRSYQEMGGVSVRFWSRHRRAAVGLGVGTYGYLVAPPGAAGDPAAALTLAHPASTVTLGWRYQATDYSTLYADASGARRSANDTTADYYNAKVGVEWKSRTSRLGFDRGVLGLQLDSGYRMSLRVKRGSFAVYVKGQF